LLFTPGRRRPTLQGSVMRLAYRGRFMRVAKAAPRPTMIPKCAIPDLVRTKPRP
jgi:hypothetical protein